MVRRATGASYPAISDRIILDSKLPALPLHEQRRIAEILDKADALRAKRRAALAQLDTLTQSIFLDMFGDPATNPKGWPVRRIGALLESACYGTSERAEANGEFPVLRMNNITRTGEIDFTDMKYMDLKESQRERYLVRTGDVLFNRTNSAELVGKTAIFRATQPMAYAGYLIRLRMNRDNDPEYLSAFLNTGYTKRVLRGMCKSIIGMANINATELQAITIPEPPFVSQREFARRVLAVESLKRTHRASLTELNFLFASLQHRAFQGEL
ncbi:MAG: restriction endonuclease subunit S [candidate division NC10 bacterium]|nr:restriction endonuclease subunit S [candidate division NC10 bacterium]MDE2321442.1 restriction endonuclease subunit S [candidate division NC10 bacterium]